MNDLWRLLFGPVSCQVEGVSVPSQALVTDIGRQAGRLVPPSPTGPLPSTDTKESIAVIQRDAVQLEATGTLPPAAQQAVDRIQTACENLQRKMNAGETLATDDPDLQALRAGVEELKNLLQPAPPAEAIVDPKAVEDRANRIDKLASGYTNSSEEQQILDILKECKNPAEVRALLDKLKEKGWSYEDLLGEMDSEGRQAEFRRLTAGTMNADQKAEAIQQLAEGYTSGRDEQAIMALLRDASAKGEMPALLQALDSKGISYLDLFGELGDNEGEFLQLTGPALSVEQRAAAIQQFAEGYTPASQERAMAALLVGVEPADHKALLQALDRKGISYERILDELDDNQRARFKGMHQLYTKLETGGTPLTVDGLKRKLLDGIPEEKERAKVEKQLQEIESQGKLTAALLTQLLALRDPDLTPLVKKADGTEAIDRNALFQQTLADLADPPSINQSVWGTCAATRVQTALALQDPAKYVELVRLLASPEGDASAVVPGMRRPTDQDLTQPDTIPQRGDQAVVGTGNRTVTTRLLSPAFMNYASEGHYVNRVDEHRYSWLERLFGSDDGGGLDSPQEERLLEGVLGTEFEWLKSGGTQADRDRLFARAEEAADSGLVPVDLRWSYGAHAVLYAGTATVPVDPHNPDGPKRQVALLINPWGQRHTMPLDEFKGRLTDVLIPGAGTPIERPDRWFDTSTYRSLQETQYMNGVETLKKLPGYDALKPALRQELESFISRNKVSAEFVQGRLAPLLTSNLLDSAAIQRLDAVAKRHPGADGEAFLGRQIDNMVLLSRSPGFQALDPDLKKRALDLLAGKDLNDDAARNLGMLAFAGRLTPNLLEEIRGSADPAAALQSKADSLPPSVQYDYHLQRRGTFTTLSPEMRRRVIDLLESKGVPFAPKSTAPWHLMANIENLIKTGRLTPEFLDELAGKASAEEVIQAIEAKAGEERSTTGSTDIKGL